MNIFCTLGQARQLKVIGEFPQGKTKCLWMLDPLNDNLLLMDRPKLCGGLTHIADAPCAQEIMEEIKRKIVKIEYHSDEGCWVITIAPKRLRDEWEVFCNGDLLSALVEAYCKMEEGGK